MMRPFGYVQLQVQVNFGEIKPNQLYKIQEDHPNHSFLDEHVEHGSNFQQTNADNQTHLHFI